MTSDTEGIYNTLKNKKTRTAHVKAIVAMVRTNHFDGVDIDYEGKSVETKEYYSAFLKELKAALPKGTILSCTIEARTPPKDLYKTIPADLEYVNDFTVINTYCDRVKIMTYDQQRAVLTLNDAAKGVYAPIADPAWVRKVLELTTKDIDADKIQLGVATYGYIYQLMPSANGKSFQYILTEAFNPGYADQIASQYGLTPVRNSAGELSLTYVPSTNPKSLPSQSKLAALAPKGTASAYLASSGALAYMKQTKKQAPVELLSWSDAKAIEDKVKLAKEFGLAGVAIFKLDGGGDKGLWSVLDKHSRLAATSGI
jgi:spore germination protein YaaH